MISLANGGRFGMQDKLALPQGFVIGSDNVSLEESCFTKGADQQLYV